jgi:hypothetical protein
MLAELQDRSGERCSLKPYILEAHGNDENQTLEQRPLAVIFASCAQPSRSLVGATAVVEASLVRRCSTVDHILAAEQRSKGSSKHQASPCYEHACLRNGARSLIARQAPVARDRRERITVQLGPPPLQLARLGAARNAHIGLARRRQVREGCAPFTRSTSCAQPSRSLHAPAHGKRRIQQCNSLIKFTKTRHRLPDEGEKGRRRRRAMRSRGTLAVIGIVLFGGAGGVAGVLSAPRPCAPRQLARQSAGQQRLSLSWPQVAS